MNAKTRQITSIEITAKEVVKIEVTETVMIAPEQEGGESREVENVYMIDGGYKPHKDLLEALLSCRKYALDLGEFSGEDRTQYTVAKVKIAGNMALQNSRVSFTLNKWVKRTGKAIKIEPGEVTMYGDEYKDATKMSKQIEKLMDEVTQYINGKNGDNQLCLSFATEEAEAK